MFNRTFLEKMKHLSVTVVLKAQVVCQLFTLWWLIDNYNRCENGQVRPLLYRNFLFNATPNVLSKLIPEPSLGIRGNVRSLYLGIQFVWCYHNAHSKVCVVNRLPGVGKVSGHTTITWANRMNECCMKKNQNIIYCRKTKTRIMVEEKS